jgi:hypothetical protein
MGRLGVGSAEGKKHSDKHQTNIRITCYNKMACIEKFILDSTILFDIYQGFVKHKSPILNPKP